MWNYHYLSRIDFRMIPIILALMVMSLLVISSYSADVTGDLSDERWITPMVRQQIQWFVMGSFVFLFFAAFDYNKLREWAWILYALIILALFGLFFTDSIARVNRWYRVPFINISLQPSEYAKLIVVITLSWFLERTKTDSRSFRTAFFSMVIVGIPFILILKQPDLGTALVLFPITLVMFYFGDIHPWIIKVMTTLAVLALIFVALIFLGVIPHEELRPYATKFIKDYQFDRLDPHTHHQKSAAIAIGIGGLTGMGWRKSEYTSGGWLPAAYTIRFSRAFEEEFGFVVLLLMLMLFYALLYFSFQVTVVAKDHFGRLLSAGITVYLGMHILVNIGMMTGFLPITGVPLVLVTYGGSSSLSTMMALGILQSIYSRRFMF